MIFIGGVVMKHNESIACTVIECKFHCNEDNYCTLNKIQVVSHTGCVSSKECTDCGSFSRK